MSTESTIITPTDIASTFLLRYDEYINVGMLTDPVFDITTSTSILRHIKNDANTMHSFFTQVTYFINLGLDDRYGSGSVDANRGLMEWNSVLCEYFIAYLNRYMISHDALIAQLDIKALHGGDNLPVPNASPHDVFKNVPWVLGDWITATPDAQH